MNVKMFLRKMNNKGSTLIEVIVSVLIVGIAFVPLLMGMTNALKANTRAEQILHAETVASNCVEVAKTFGMEDFSKVKADPDILAATSVTGSGTSYTASSISEGLDTFNVSIAFNAYYTDADGNTALKPQNTTKYMNFNNIRGAYTVTHTQSADETRLDSYRAIAGSNADTVPIPDTVETNSLVKRKQTVLTIGRYGASDANANAWHIDSAVSYLMVNSDGTNSYFEKDGDYKAFVEASPTVQICGTGNADCPNTIILFYSTLADSIGSLNAAGGSNKECIFIDNQTGQEVNVYIFISGADIDFNVGATTSSNMYVGTLNSTGSSTNIFCSADPVSYTGIYTSAADKALLDALWEDTKFESTKPTSSFTKISAVSNVEGALSLVAQESGKMVYDVIVTVSDTNGNTLASKTATIIE